MQVIDTVVQDCELSNDLLGYHDANATSAPATMLPCYAAFKSSTTFFARCGLLR